jgi:hypothetical protein
MINKVKKLVIDIEPSLHTFIKKRALEREMSIKKWMSFAIAEYIKLEAKMGLTRVINEPETTETKEI